MSTTNLPFLFIALTVLSAALAMLAVWSRRSLAIRVIAVIALTAVLVLEYFALTDLLSRPKPAALELAGEQIDKATVLAASIEEGSAIYLWLRLPNIQQPRYYVMPWEQKSAVELQRAIRESRKTGQHVMIDLPFEPSIEIREAPRFYSLPQPRLPLKPRPNVQEYRHPTLGA